MGSNSFEDYLRDEDPDFYTLLSSKESFGSSLPSNCSTSEPAGLQSLHDNQPTNTGPVSGEVDLGRVPGVAQYQAAPNPNFPYFSQLQPNNQQAMSTMPYVIPTQMYQQGHLPKITSAADHFVHEGTRISKEQNFQVISPHMMNAMPAQMMGNTMALQNPMQAMPQLSQHQPNQYQMQMASLQNSAMVQQTQQAPPVQQNLQQPPNPHQQQQQSQPSHQPQQQQAVAPPPQLQHPLLQQQHQQDTPQQSRSIPQDLSTSGSVQNHPIETPADRTKNWVDHTFPPIEELFGFSLPSNCTTSVPAGLQSLNENQTTNTGPVSGEVDLAKLVNDSERYETLNTPEFDQMFRPPLPKASEDEFTNENNYANSFQIKEGLIPREIHQESNTEIQNEKTDPVIGECPVTGNENNFEYIIENDDHIVLQPQDGNCYENVAMLFQNGKDFNQNKSFSAAENADFHRNETNAGYVIQGNHATRQQAPLITVNQQSQIKDALNCFLEEGYNVRSKEQRMHAAMVLHNNGLVKKINDRVDSVYVRSKERQFHCDLCPSGKVRWFTNMLTLRRHFCQHLGHKPLACRLPTCEERFYRKDKLRLHIQKHHPGFELPPKRRR